MPNDLTMWAAAKAAAMKHFQPELDRMEADRLLGECVRAALEAEGVLFLSGMSCIRKFEAQLGGAHIEAPTLDALMEQVWDRLAGEGGAGEVEG